MISIERIRIHNFRQYRDITLDFPNKTGITFFSGENGMGKSNFMNALCWCLYGETPFKQTASSDESGEDSIINLGALSKGDDTVEVEIIANINDRRYRIIRSSNSSRLLSTWASSKTELRVFEIQGGGNSVPLDSPTLLIDQLLPQSLRDLFIFDGEDIKRMFENDYNVTLRNNVYKVSNVDILKRATNDIEVVVRQLNKQLRSNQEDDALRKRHEELLETNERDNERIRTDIGVQEQKLRQYESREDEIKKALETFKETDKLVQEENRIKKEMRRIDNDVDEENKSLRNQLVSLLPFSRLYSQTVEYSKAVAKAAKNREIPPAIATSVLEGILTSSECICHTHLDADKLLHIETLRNDSKRKDELSFLREHTSICEQKIELVKASSEQLTKLDSKIDTLARNREDLEKRLREVEELIEKSNAFRDMKNPEEDYRKLKQSIGECYQVIGVLKNKQSDLAISSKRSQEFIDESIADTHENKIIHEKIVKLESAIRAFEVIESKIIDQTRLKIEEGTTESFKRLHWKPEINRIVFAPDYSLQVERTDGTRQPLSSMGTGEHKMLGISIINALSNKLPNFEFPFFIDGPIEQLDEKIAPKVLHNLGSLSENKQVFVMTLNHAEIKEYLETLPAEQRKVLTRPVDNEEVTSIRVSEGS